MPAISASAPGKIILFGEHAVVYGRPAIAVPVAQVRAKAIVTAEPRAAPGNVRIQAPDIGVEADLGDLPAGDPLGEAVRQVLAATGVARPPALRLRITSTIPVAAGLGSGAAVSVAIIRALSTFLGKPLPDKRVSALAFEVEKLHHGTPSGIDNSVVTYKLPVYFQRVAGDEPVIETLQVPAPFTVVIADTGIPSPTAVAVAGVRRGWQSDPVRFERLFDGVAEIVANARRAIEDGRVEALGALMDANHVALQAMGVSSGELDSLAEAARAAGASGAKLSGGGRGGNLIALVAPEDARPVSLALEAAGAKQLILTTVAGHQPDSR